MTHPSSQPRPFVVALTGASGAAYGVRLLQVLAGSGREIHLVMSHAAAQVLRDELGIVANPDRLDVESFAREVLAWPGWTGNPRTPTVSVASAHWRYHHYDDWSAGIASGSFLTAGMAVCPCSMSTLAAIASGLSTNLIQRAADVHLKERRRLVLVPRETPLNLIQLENMAQCLRAGAVLLPAMPGWYNRPRSLEDLVDFVVGRVCDHLGMEHALVRRWGQEPMSGGSPA